MSAAKLHERAHPGNVQCTEREDFRVSLIARERARR